jgi:hypothetical protein
MNGGDDETRTRDLCRDNISCGLGCGLKSFGEDRPERYLLRGKCSGLRLLRRPEPNRRPICVLNSHMPISGAFGGSYS